jgi:glycosyltransferase involved in cell wall biosynthesis
MQRYIGGKASFQWLPNTIDVNSIDHRATHPVSCDFTDHKPPRFLAIGRLVRQKGFDLLLQAFAIVRERRPEWSLHIVGSGPERARLGSLAVELGVEKAVAWSTATSNPFPLYRWADLVLVPSRFEGFPNVPLEAMALGRAVIFADCKTGPRELTENGRFGRLVPVGDVEALARAILELGDSAEAREKLGVAAREHVARTYGTEAARARYAEILGLSARHD